MLPLAHTPVNVGVVLFVMSSFDEIPESVSGVILEAPEVVGAVVSMVIERGVEVEILPAVSTNLTMTECTPSLKAVSVGKLYSEPPSSPQILLV